MQTLGRIQLSGIGFVAVLRITEVCLEQSRIPQLMTQYIRLIKTDYLELISHGRRKRRLGFRSTRHSHRVISTWGVVMGTTWKMSVLFGEQRQRFMQLTTPYSVKRIISSGNRISDPTHASASHNITHPPHTISRNSHGPHFSSSAILESWIFSIKAKNYHITLRDVTQSHVASHTHGSRTDGVEEIEEEAPFVFVFHPHNLLGDVLTAERRTLITLRRSNVYMR